MERLNLQKMFDDLIACNTFAVMAYTAMQVDEKQLSEDSILSIMETTSKYTQILLENLLEG